MILIYIYTVGAYAAPIETHVENTVSGTYFYDAETGIVSVSVIYSGEDVSAIGVLCEYDVSFMDYTGYERGRGFDGFNIAATLDNSGRVRILAYSPSDASSGEMIRLYFKIKDTSKSVGYKLKLAPLTNNTCAKIENGAIVPVSVSFSPVHIQTYGDFPMEFCGINPSGELLLLTDKSVKACIYDITVVDLHGVVTSRRGLCFTKEVRTPHGDGAIIPIKLLTVLSPHTAIIIDAYAVYKGKTCYQRSVLLFYDGELLE